MQFLLKKKQKKKLKQLFINIINKQKLQMLIENIHYFKGN